MGDCLETEAQSFQRRFGETKLPKRKGKVKDLTRPLTKGGFIKPGPEFELVGTQL